MGLARRACGQVVQLPLGCGRDQVCAAPWLSLAFVPLIRDVYAVTGAVEGYNDVDDLGGADYSWGGAGFATPAEFATGTSLGAHDLDSTTGSATSDAANSAAPGELPEDVRDYPRDDDPS